MLLPALLAAASLSLASIVVAPSANASTEQHDGKDHQCSASVRIDRFSDALDKTKFEGRSVGNLSGLAVDKHGQLAAISDRSSLFTLDAQSLRPTGVVELHDEKGNHLDAEAVVVDPRHGERLVASETEPSVRRYKADGTLLGRLSTPKRLLVAPAGRARSNLTFEGLAAPGDNTLIASMEGAITGDSPDIRRFQIWKRDKGEFELAEQYGYRADAGLGVSEITPTGDGRLLTLERGWTEGYGDTVRLYVADPRRASDVSGIDTLNGQQHVRLIEKTLLTDIGQCPSLGATAKQPQPNPLLDNIEGMTITGRNDNQSLKLLMVSDDNDRTDQTTRLYFFAVHLPQ